MGSLCSGVQGAFSGSQNQNKVEDRTQRQASAGATSGAGATTGATNYNLGNWAGWAANQLPTAFNWAQDTTKQAAGPVNNDWQKYLTPFAGDQIKANLAATAIPEAQQRSHLLGEQSGNPYASSNRGQNQLFEAALAAQHGQMAAGVNNQSFTQSLQAAQEDARRALQAGQTSGALTTQNLNVGQIIPYGGQTTAGTTAQQQTSSGTVDSTGHNVSNATTTNTPSIASTLGTVAGIGANVLPFLALSDERVKENVKEVGKTHDGQPIYKFNYLGQPATQLGLLAQDVEQTHPHAVHDNGLKHVDYDAATKRAERKDGGSTSFHGKVEDAFHAFHRMRQHAQNGGKVAPKMQLGGIPDVWNTTVSPETSDDPDNIIGRASYNQGKYDAGNSGMGLMDRTRGILGAFGQMGMQSPGTSTSNVPGAAQPERRSLAAEAAGARPALEALQGQMSRTYDGGGRVGYDDGGGVGDWLGSLAKGLTPNSPFAPPDSPSSRILEDEYGVNPRAMFSPSRNLVQALTSINPMVPGGPATLTGIPGRMAQENEAAFKGADRLGQHAEQTGRTATGRPTMAAQQLAQTGNIALGQAVNPQTGRLEPTLAGKKNPAEVAHLEATSEPAMIRIKAIEQANTLHAQRLKSIDDMEFIDKNPVANAEFYRAQREAANIAHQAALQRLQGSAPSGVKTWNPNLPNGGL